MAEAIVTPEVKGTTETPGTEQPVEDSILGSDDAQAGTPSGEPKGQESTEPDPYDAVTVPEGAEVDADFIGDVKAWAKESKVLPETLTKLLTAWGDRAKASSAKAEKSAAEQLTARNKEWTGALKADKTFGGKDYDTNVKEVKSFLSKVDPDKSFRNDLVKAGVANWPPLVKFLHSIAKADKDDSIASTVGNPASTPADSEEAQLDEMYPTMKKR
jgi:hypothetical protein